MRSASAALMRSILAFLLVASVVSCAWPSDTNAQQVSPKAIARKIYKRPLLRPVPIQFCLKSLDFYEGRFQPRFTRATMRGLQRFRDDLKLNADDVEYSWALHAVLWRLCRPKWLEAGGSLDRFGFAVVAAEGSVSTGPPPPKATVAAARPAPSPDFCLAPDLRSILLRSAGRRIDIPACTQACLPRPPQIEPADARAYERRLAFSWCAACDPVAASACLDPRLLVRVQPGTAGAPGSADARSEARALFRRDITVAEPHRAIAIVIGVSDYQHGLPSWPRAVRDASAMRTLLSERLGYAPGRIIDLRNPSRADIEDVFGRSGDPRGLVAERLKAAPGTPLLIYFSGLGTISRDDDAAYLMPSDAIPGREKSTGFALSWLFRNLAAVGAGPVTIVIEADFASDPGAPAVTPNAPETSVRVLPRAGLRNITVITSSDRDQRPLGDQETALSLFTRHLIAGLSGHADSAPNGNEDNLVDTAEAFVYAAQRTRVDASRLWGVLQSPAMSHGRPLPILRIGR